jgi:hypothetical protein
MIHVDHGHVRVPLVEDRLNLGQASRLTDDEHAVVERQLDEVHDQLAIVEHQGATRLGLLRVHVVTSGQGASSLGFKTPAKRLHVLAFGAGARADHAAAALA